MVTWDVALPNDRPQVMLSGTVHGDERIGPVAITHYVESLISDPEANKDIL